MMTKKKRGTILTIIIIVVLLIIVSTCLLLYAKTDMFKSNQSLFVKYLGQNKNNLEVIENIISQTEYDDKLKNNIYNETIQANINYTQNVGTTEENNDNAINQLKLTIEGQVDNNSQYDYRNINLLKNDETISQVEYLRSGDDYGVRFTDLFNQYVVSENTNLKELFKKMGYTDEEINSIPDTINVNVEFLEEIKLSDEEFENLSEKYVGIISQDLSKTNFSKQSKQIISIDGQDYIANAYILTLTKEQLNNIYIKLLQEIKQDETILNKIEVLQNKINEVTLGNNDINLNEDFVNKIERTIQKINQNNIGSDETKIIVYESGGETIRTRIETLDYQTNIDFLQLEDSCFAELLITEEQTEKYKITLKNSNGLNIIINDSEEENTINLRRVEEINNQTVRQDYNIVYEIEDKRININISKQMGTLQELEERKEFNTDNSVMLNYLNETQMQEIINIVRNGLTSEIEAIKEEINYEDIMQMLMDIELINNSTILDSNTISETEKNRFNSIFEMLQGENLSGENVSASIQTVGNSIQSMEVVSNNELKLTIVRNHGDEEVVDTITSYLEESRNANYSVTVQYDENGLVNGLIITIEEDD